MCVVHALVWSAAWTSHRPFSRMAGAAVLGKGVNGMQTTASGREKIGERELGDRQIVGWLFEAPEDLRWDSFLMGTPLGQYQQSSMWAIAKATEGWKVARVVFTEDEKVVGGFQVLYKSSWWGGIGYVSKGPVLEHPSEELARFAVDLLQTICARLRLRALVVQLPDECDDRQFHLVDRGFLMNALGKVIESTWLIGLAPKRHGMERAMTANTRQEVRQAIRRGIVTREGSNRDLPVFFDLMRSSCRRQGVNPSPRRIDFLHSLWGAASPSGSIKLFFAEYEDTPVCGLLCIIFGRRVNFWKKGWNESEGNRHPNELLMSKSLEWAASKGYEDVDFGSFDDESAVAMLRDANGPAEYRSSRHFFNARFGGRPMILPAAMIFIPNPLLRLAYRLVFNSKIRRAVERRREMDAARREALGREETLE